MNVLQLNIIYNIPLYKMKIRKFVLKVFNGKTINRNENIHWKMLKKVPLEQRSMENFSQNP